MRPLFRSDDQPDAALNSPGCEAHVEFESDGLDRNVEDEAAESAGIVLPAAMGLGYYLVLARECRSF